jgi:hypothetical protein
MIQAWVFEGSPLGDRVIGGFEGWSRTFGGILAVAGVDGFLGNLDDFYETADNETSALTSLIATWWDVHQDNAVGVSKLFPIALRVGVDLGEGKALSQKTRLGKLIAAQRDRVIAALKVELVGKPHGSALWRLRPASTHVHPGASGQHPPSRVAGGPQRQRPPAGEQVIPDPVEVGGRAPSAPVYVRAEMGRSNDVPPRPHVHLVDSAPEPEPIDVPEDILDQAPPPDPDWFAGLVANIDAQVEAGDGPG